MSVQLLSKEAFPNAHDGVRHKTPRLTSRYTFKISHDYSLVLPIAAYQSWKGVQIEGKGVEPQVEVSWSFEDAVAGRDRQLEYALTAVRSL